MPTQTKLDNTKKAQNIKVSKELAELKVALETRISTVDEARLAEQHKLEGLLPSHRSDLDKKQAALETDISTVERARLADQQKLESLLTSHRSEEFALLMNENKAIKSSIEDLKSPTLDTSHDPLVSKPELDKLKASLETHISTEIGKDGVRLAEQQKHEDQLTELRGQFENFKQMTETAFTGVGKRMHQQNSVIGADIDDATRYYLRNDNIVSKLRDHQKQLSRFSSQQTAQDTQLSILKAMMDSKVDGPTLNEGLRKLSEKVDKKEDKSNSLIQPMKDLEVTCRQLLNLKKDTEKALSQINILQQTKLSTSWVKSQLSELKNKMDAKDHADSKFLFCHSSIVGNYVSF